MTKLTIDQLPFHYNKHYAFIHVFEQLAKRYQNNIFAHYPTADGFQSLTYGQINQLATTVATQCVEEVKSGDTVALLGDHSVQYLVTQLAFLKLRVVLVCLSTRNSQPANVNLIQKTDTKLIYATGKYADMARAVAVDSGTGCEAKIMPVFNIQKLLHSPADGQALDHTFGPENIEKTALVLHSSGSTNFPKPIRLSNRYLICLIQSFNLQLVKMHPDLAPSGKDVQLTSLPLFHIFGFFAAHSQALTGGSNAILDKLPPMPADIMSICRNLHVSHMALPPLVVVHLHSYLKETMDFAPLQKMKYIIYGGAALKVEIGDYLHKNGINVRAVYGTTETNATSSSDLYRGNKDWDLLRPIQMVEPYCTFEPVDEAAGLYHLVVRGDSPFLATGVANRANGDYATNDIFKRVGPKGYYRHMGRLDDTLVMENGEKTNPIPMEQCICTLPLVEMCTIVGEGRQCTAALVELRYEEAVKLTPQQIIDQVQDIVKEANKEAPSHSVLLPQMVYILPLNQHLVSTDKGTVIRKRSSDKFKDVIEKMYRDLLEGGASSSEKFDKATVAIWTAQDVQHFLLQSAADILQKSASQLDAQASLFDFGLNSLLAIQLRNRISDAFDSVPTNILFEYPAISDLAEALLKLRDGETKDEATVIEERYQEAQALKNSYLERAAKDFTVCKQTPQAHDRPHVVLLTGATGSLGSFMLRDMLQSPRVKKVVALVRGKRDQLYNRLEQTFINRRLDVSLLSNGKLEVLPMNLEAPYLGWDAATYDRLRQEVTLVQACAWLLDFNQPVSHYDKECIQGLYNLLKFAHRDVDPMYVHTISSVSCMAARGTPEIPETHPEDDPHVAMPMGYGQSKYIVEHLFNYLTREKNFPCIVERMGQVVGDTINGVWNTSEQYPLLIVGGGSGLHKMPDIQTDIDWLPVDHAATGIFEIMLSTANKSAADVAGMVYHIVNPRMVTWNDVLDAMKTCGMEFETTTPTEWVAALAKDQSNPAYKLMGFYENNFKKPFQMPIFKTDKTVQEAPALASAPPFDAGLLSKQLSYWKSIGFL